MLNIWKIPRYWPTIAPSFNKKSSNLILKTQVNFSENPRNGQGSLSLALVVRESTSSIFQLYNPVSAWSSHRSG